MSLGQAALKWVLADPNVVSALPNVYGDEQLAEFALASEKPDLTSAQLDRVTELSRVNFGVDEPAIAFKGTMQRAAAVSGRG